MAPKQKTSSTAVASPAAGVGHAGEEARPQTRGSRQGGVRLYNERVVLHALRRQGELAAADLARQTQLTAQTISLIAKSLHVDGLVLKGDPQRGKVGQPAVPLRLNPEGAFAIGIQIGRRRMDVLLVDFVGQVRERWSLDYEFPQPVPLMAEIGKRLKQIGRALGRDRSDRLQGIGVACPLSLGGWQALLGIDETAADTWRDVDLRAAVSRLTDLPVTLIKDTAAACLAELVMGHGREVKSFLYVFVDTFVGGGLVIDSHLRAGLHGNAGAVGSMALRPSLVVQGTPPQLLSEASLLGLESRYTRARLDLAALTDARALKAPWLLHTIPWLSQACDAIAWAVQCTACMLDLEAVVIDGSFSRELRGALHAEVEQALGRYDWEGVVRPTSMPGSIGADARALGAALLPLHANFAPDRDLFLKLSA